MRTAIILIVLVFVCWWTCSSVVDLSNMIAKDLRAPDTTIVIKNGKADTTITIRK